MSDCGDRRADSGRKAVKTARKGKKIFLLKKETFFATIPMIALAYNMLNQVLSGADVEMSCLRRGQGKEKGMI